MGSCCLYKEKPFFSLPLSTASTLSKKQRNTNDNDKRIRPHTNRRHICRFNRHWKLIQDEGEKEREGEGRMKRKRGVES